MSIESPADLAGMCAVGRVVAETLRELRAAVRPGVTTAWLDGVAATALRGRRARPVPAVLLGFPGSCCLSVNDEAVHGVPGPRRLRAGDLVKIDVTAELDGYVADAAVSVVLPGATGRAQPLANAARAALVQALRAARAGRPLAGIGRAVEAEVRRRGFHVLSELGGHGTGRTMWEAPSVPNVDGAGGQLLHDGLVLAIEPIIASRRDGVVQAPDGWTLRTRGGSLAAHVEHTVVVRHGRPLVVTAL
ncbi:MAG TPA: type I methionyl aminopeptidase [Candidatus Dormibacteraeota bacterium]|nr:type I methionyl aminopeptidase [Candidatus Dormibacteraeota bacterium]